MWLGQETSKQAVDHTYIAMTQSWFVYTHMLLLDLDIVRLIMWHTDYVNALHLNSGLNMLCTRIATHLLCCMVQA